MKKILTAFTLIFPLWACAAAHDPNETPLNTVAKIADGLYTGSCICSSGETVYFGMELVTPENIEGWRLFTQRIKALYDLNIIRGLARPIVKKILTENSWKGVSGYPQHLYGYTEDEIRPILEDLKKNKGKLAGLREVAYGLNGFYLTSPDDERKFYVVYASKTPVIGPFDTSKFTTDSGGFMPFKDFNDRTRDLLMVVGSTFCSTIPGTDRPSEKYINRGIFRLPVSFLDGGYKGLALLLHGFTGAVAQTYIPSHPFMTVNPDANPVMRGILNNALKQDDLKEGSEELPRPRGSRFDIKVSSLSRFYTHATK